LTDVQWSNAQHRLQTCNRYAAYNPSVLGISQTYDFYVIPSQSVPSMPIPS
jgi:hypothetical protein